MMASLAFLIGLVAVNFVYAQTAPETVPLKKNGTSKLNMVATVHPAATAAGVEAFANGGNAIDAAVAAALTLGVVDGYNSGIGGGCFILIRTASGEVIAIDGREMAPAAAQRDMYLENGVANPDLSQTGPLASAVPGALAAFANAVQDFGQLNLSKLILPAARIAEEGFAVTPYFHGALTASQTDLARFPGSRAVLLQTDGTAWGVGEPLKQPDLATTYQQISKNGIAWFYNGPFANQTEKWFAANGGIITARDFANYRTVRRDPIRTTYRGYEVIGFPPPSSGGVHVAQILNILENFDLAQLHRENPATVRHLVAEAMKLAFADRAYWLGDPDSISVPRGLIDKVYAKELAQKIRLERSTPVTAHGQPPRADSDFFTKHTTHIAAADSQGNWIGITSTVNTTFGSKVIVPGLGVIMNNQMDDFSIAPGVPNAFGLIGGENNAIAAGKRPLSSMSPTIVLKDGQPILTVGAAGGPQIISQVVWAIVNRLDLELSMTAAVAAPRLHHQWSPDRLLIEETMPGDVAEQLQQRGHELQRSAVVGLTQAIALERESGLFVGVSDPRTGGAAAGN